jgi:hypothetical protein
MERQELLRRVPEQRLVFIGKSKAEGGQDSISIHQKEGGQDNSAKLKRQRGTVVRIFMARAVLHLLFNRCIIVCYSYPQQPAEAKPQPEKQKRNVR